MSIPHQPTRAWADISLSAILANARAVAAASGARLLPMLKANGYGLGAIPVARALERIDPWGFGVATPEEGAELRAAGIPRPLIAFTPLLPDEIPVYLQHDLRPTIGDPEALAAWLAQGQGRPFHVEADTGMSRSGFRWNEVAAWAPLLRDARGWEGVFTHFHSADEAPQSIEVQWQRFTGVLGALPSRPPVVHAANSGAALRGDRYAGDFVRPGIFLFGGEAANRSPEPVVRLRARVVATRAIPAGETVSYAATWTAPGPTSVVTLGLGYADGLPRSLSNRGLVELNGRLAPVVGRVTMDFVMVAPDIPCGIGDVATIYGGIVSLDEQARRAGTISYELLTAIGPRVPRQYQTAP
jgi:alanine racemase